MQVRQFQQVGQFGGNIYKYGGIHSSDGRFESTVPMQSTVLTEPASRWKLTFLTILMELTVLTGSTILMKFMVLAVLRDLTTLDTTDDSNNSERNLEGERSETFYRVEVTGAHQAIHEH